MLHQVWPPPGRELGDPDLEELYAYPDREDGWLAVNFVSSIDGGIAIDGRSRGLSTPADRRVFALGHDLADVVLLASGTAVAEEYPGLRPTAERTALRARHGLTGVPPLAVVSSGSLPPDAASLVDVVVPTIVVSSHAVGAGRERTWRAAGAEVVLAGEHAVDLGTALAALAARGLRRIDCEGGPALVGALLAADLVDEMRVSTAPLAIAGSAGRLARTDDPLDAPRGFALASLLVDDDGTLLARYVRDRER